MSRHTKSKDLLYEAVILKFLVKVALMAVKNEQPIRPHLARLCMLVKVLQPRETKLIVRLAIL